MSVTAKSLSMGAKCY